MIIISYSSLLQIYILSDIIEKIAYYNFQVTLLFNALNNQICNLSLAVTVH